MQLQKQHHMQLQKEHHRENLKLRLKVAALVQIPVLRMKLAKKKNKKKTAVTKAATPKATPQETPKCMWHVATTFGWYIKTSMLHRAVKFHSQMCVISHARQERFSNILNIMNSNRAYLENASFKACASSTLKFYIFCGVHQTKKC